MDNETYVLIMQAMTLLIIVAKQLAAIRKSTCITKSTANESGTSTEYRYSRDGDDKEAV